MHYYQRSNHDSPFVGIIHTREYWMVRQNFQLQAIRKSLCLPFMFPEWQCRHIRGSLLPLLLLGKQPILQSSSTNVKNSTLLMATIILHSSSVQSIVSLLSITRRNLVQTCRDSIAFRLRKLAPSTCANDRSRSTRSRADSAITHDHSSKRKKKEKLCYSKNLLSIALRIYPICPLSLTPFTSTCFLLTKLTRTTFIQAWDRSGRNERRRFVRESSTLGLQNNEFSLIRKEQLKE